MFAIGTTGNQPKSSGPSHHVKPNKTECVHPCQLSYLSPPEPVVSPRWTPVYGCCSSTFSHQLFCTLTTQGAAMIRPWRQGLQRGPAVDASWKLKAGPCQEACLLLVREQRDRPLLADSHMSVRAAIILGNSLVEVLHQFVKYNSPVCQNVVKNMLTKPEIRQRASQAEDSLQLKKGLSLLLFP